MYGTYTRRFLAVTGKEGYASALYLVQFLDSHRREACRRHMWEYREKVPVNAPARTAHHKKSLFEVEKREKLGFFKKKKKREERIKRFENLRSERAPPLPQKKFSIEGNGGIGNEQCPKKEKGIKLKKNSVR